MIKKLTLILFALIATGLTTNAQLCGFDHQHNQLLSTNAAYAQRTANFNADWTQGQYHVPNGLIVNTSQGPVYEIPVVIHVIHTGGGIGSIYNPTDARLSAMIDYLNASYATTWAGYPDSLSGGTRFPVRFALAKRSPTCGATTGINRVNGSSVAGYTANGILHNGSVGADEATIKALSIWNNHDYYNIWVVNKIDGLDGTVGTFTAGYAYFPGAPANLDGTIMLATQAIPGEITLPHEIRHAFSLYHVFQGDGSGSTCPPTGNCAATGDLICDTEPMKRSVFNCPPDPNPCTGNSYNNTQHNFMDYSNCQDRFTPGQRTRFLASMLADRSSLISSLGATAPASALPTACVPPSILNPGNSFDAGVYEVKLNDLTGTSDGGYTSDNNQFYVDRTCTQRANLLAGQAYTLSVATGPNPERVRVWIDYNNDGNFAATELIYSHDGTGSFETHTTSYNVPTTNVTNCTPLRMRVVSDRTTAAVPTACGSLTFGQAEDYTVFITGPSNTASVSIALTNGTNPSCTNSPLTFTATPAGSATSVTYKWYVNGVAVTGATSNVFTSSTLANGNVVTSRVFYTGPCGADSALSNNITVLRSSALVPAVSIAITAGSNPGCVGQSITFTATPTNGGSVPTYTWQTFNGTTYTTVPGNTANTFTTSTLPCGFGVRAILTSNLSCASPLTATSATTIYNCSPVTSTVSIAQTGGTNPTCAGKPVTFTATVTNPGPTPVYNWTVNGFSTGASGTSFTTTALNNGDVVRLNFITSNPCVAEPNLLSNTIAVTVIPIDTPKVTLTLTAGSNPGCTDSLLEYTAVASSNGGASSYAWFLNNNRAGTGPVYGSYAFADGDQIFVRVLAGPGCHVSDTTFSDVITVVRYPTPPTPTISFIGNMLVSSVPGVNWYGPNSNSLAASGVSSYHPAGPGNYYARSVVNGCPSLPSNILQVSLLKIGNFNMDGVQIYPNPTTGVVNFNFPAATDLRITIYTPTGQAVMHDEVKHANRKSIDLSGYAAGIYFVTLQDNQGKTGTVRITLTK